MPLKNTVDAFQIGFLCALQMYAPPHPGLFSSSSYRSAGQSSFGPQNSWMPNVTRPPPPQADPYFQQSNRLQAAPLMFNQGFGDRSGFYRCETNHQGNGQWKKLMMEMKGLEEKKARIEEQHLQQEGSRSGGMSLQERRLQQEETLLGRRFREERDKMRRFEGQDYGGQSEGCWVSEQRNEKDDWRAEKKVRLEEARELDRMWDMVKRKGKCEGRVPEMRGNWPEKKSGMGLNLNRAEQAECGSRRTPDLSDEIAERERELRKREEKLRQEERKLEEISRAEKERNLREREERLRRKERELEEFYSARKSRNSVGDRERSRSSDRSSSWKYDKVRSSKSCDHEEKHRKLRVDEEQTLEISIPNQPGDLRRQDDDRGRREMSSFSSRSVSSKGESGVGSRDVRRVDYDHNEMQKQLREEEERELFGRSGARRLRRSRSRQQEDEEAMPRAPVKLRLGVKRGVKERLGKRSKVAKQEMERDLRMGQYEGRVIAELQVSFCHLFDPLLVDPFNLFHLQTCLFIICAFQERPLHLDGDEEDLDMFDQDEDAWSEEEEDYIL